MTGYEEGRANRVKRNIDVDLSEGTLKGNR